MEQSRDVVAAEKNQVDQAVGGAETSFEPDREGWEEDGDDAQEEVATAHCADWIKGQRCVVTKIRIVVE